MGNETTIFQKNSMTLAKNGSVGVWYYHEEPIVCTSDVLVLKYKFKNLTKYEGLFFKVLIEQHIFRFNYGRKITKDSLKEIHDLVHDKLIHKANLCHTNLALISFQYLKDNKYYYQ